MEAPDKIYIFPEGGLDGERTWYPKKEAFATEYIRKDALLAFLNERRKGLSSGESFSAGERKMLKELIEKIESL